MANLRLFSVNAVVRNITFAKHRCLGVVVRREKHLLVRNALLNNNYTDSRKLLAGLRSPNLYSVQYRFEHGIPGASATEINENLSSPPPPSTPPSPPPTPPPHSSDDRLNAEETTIGNNVQSPLTQAPQGTISENQGITELAGSSNELILPPIPEVGNPNMSLPIGEENLASIGLGGWSPSGMIQQELHFLHVTFDLPWWACIVCSTIVLRLLLTPFQIKGKRLMNEYMNKVAEIQRLQKKVNDAKMTGNPFEVVNALQEYMALAQNCKLMDGKRLFYMFINAPFFISFFFALRQMADTPDLTSFQTGGLFWFTNLSVPDQFYLLPCTMGLTTFFLIAKSFRHQTNIVLKLGTSTVLPIIVTWFMSHCSTAILCYSVTSNFYTVAQTLILDMERVRKYFQIPLPPPLPKLKSQKKGHFAALSEHMNSMKLLRELDDRERLNAIKFEECSSAPMKKTFKYKPPSAQVLLQKKTKSN